MGRQATVVANVSNFVPKPQTPYQWAAMQRRRVFRGGPRALAAAETDAERGPAFQRRGIDADRGAPCAAATAASARPSRPAWRRGARLDAWAERMRPWLWREAIAAAGIDLDAVLHQAYAEEAVLPWEHMRGLEGCTKNCRKIAHRG